MRHPREGGDPSWLASLFRGRVHSSWHCWRAWREGRALSVECLIDDDNTTLVDNKLAVARHIISCGGILIGAQTLAIESLHIAQATEQDMRRARLSVS